MSYEMLLTRWHWLQLSTEQRQAMRDAFNIPKSGGVEMQNGKIMSDGSNESDLKAVNVQSMQTFLDSTETSFENLYNLTIKKIDEMIEDHKAEAQAEEDKKNAVTRKETVENMVDSLLETITNLPMDAQIRIKTALGSTGNNTNVKESTSTKEGKKGSNKRSAESTGSGSKSSEGLG